MATSSEDAAGFDLDALRADIAESCEIAWKQVIGDGPVPEDALEVAVDAVLAEGVAGIPGIWVAYYLDPREALAAALEDADTRAELLRADIRRQNVLHEFDGRALPREPAFKRMNRAVERRRRELRGAPPATFRRRTRTRSSRQRRIRRGSSGCRSPGRSDSDEEPPDSLLARLLARVVWRGRGSA